jgi:hypothetical protein
MNRKQRRAMEAKAKKGDKMMKFEEYYANKQQVYCVIGLKEVREAAANCLSGKKTKTGKVPKEQKDLLVKINNHIKRFGLNVDSGDILHKILKDEVVASFLQKSPTKQNLSEHSQLGFLKDERGYLNMESLPSDGCGSWRLVDGKLIKDKKKKEVEKSYKHKVITKSVDYICQDEMIFAKYTTGYGGHQDNQYIDVKIFLSQAIKYLSCREGISPSFRFCILIDGDYYNTGRFAELNKMIDDAEAGQFIRVVNSDEY